MWMRVKQIHKQVDGVLPCGLVVTIHENVEQQLKYLVHVPNIQQLSTITVMIYT